MKGPITWEMFPFDDVIMCVRSNFDGYGLYLLKFCGVKSYKTQLHRGQDAFSAMTGHRSTMRQALFKTSPVKLLLFLTWLRIGWKL